MTIVWRNDKTFDLSREVKCKKTIRVVVNLGLASTVATRDRIDVNESKIRFKFLKFYEVT